MNQVSGCYNWSTTRWKLTTQRGCSDIGATRGTTRTHRNELISDEKSGRNSEFNHSSGRDAVFVAVRRMPSNINNGISITGPIRSSARTDRCDPISRNPSDRHTLVNKRCNLLSRGFSASDSIARWLTRPCRALKYSLDERLRPVRR